MSLAENFAERVEYYCDNDRFGYDQTYRWGQYGDFDCSSLMYQCGYDIGLDLPGKNGESTNYYRYTGDMVQTFSAAGCSILTLDTTSDKYLERGDILLNVVNHTVAYLGNGLVGGARINERGGVSGGTPGDQTGKEICQHDYYNYPWDYVIRMPRTDEGDGYYGVLDIDGYVGEYTIRRMQTVFGTWVDGSVWHQWPENEQGAFVKTAWCYDYSLAGSPVIRELQQWLNVDSDGIIGFDTICAMQRRFGTTVDGELWQESPCVMELQKWLNNQL